MELERQESEHLRVFYSIRDAARTVGLPVSTVYHYVLKGDIPTYTIGGYKVVHIEDVREVMQSRKPRQKPRQRVRAY